MPKPFDLKKWLLGVLSPDIVTTDGAGQQTVSIDHLDTEITGLKLFEDDDVMGEDAPGEGDVVGIAEAVQFASIEDLTSMRGEVASLIERLVNLESLIIATDTVAHPVQEKEIW